MVRRPKVLVVYKKDAYQQYLQEEQDSRLVQLLRRRHPDVLDMQRAHAVHEEAIEAVVRTLRLLAVDFDVAYRASLTVTTPYDLVVSVGGDGTFLQAAHHVKKIPILGVNSDPSRSEAVFCAATHRTFPRLCREALAGRLPRETRRGDRRTHVSRGLPELRLYRLQVSLNGKRLPHRVLNDVLVTHDDPATMSRYRLRIGSREEFQKSSGLWVATAAGSSSAVLAAGGIRLPWGAKQFQYRPRELYRGRLARARLRGGVLWAHQSVLVTWLMRRGSAFIDGPHLAIPLRFADQLEVRLSLTDPLLVLGLKPTAG